MHSVIWRSQKKNIRDMGSRIKIQAVDGDNDEQYL
jgi:hypothetical protein